MISLFLSPVVFAFLLLAAHFYRGSHFLLMVLALGLPLALGLRRAWVAPLLQACLLLGSLEWLRSATLLAMARAAAGAPYLRLLLILGAVALLTALSALLLRTQRVRQHFRAPQPPVE